MPIERDDQTVAPERGGEGGAPVQSRRSALDQAGKLVDQAWTWVRTGTEPYPNAARSNLQQAQAILVGHEALVDPKTGKIRDTTWWEDHGYTVMALVQAGAAVAGGFWLSGLNAAASSGTLPSGVTLQGVAAGPGSTTVPAASTGSLASLGTAAPAATGAGGTAAAAGAVAPLAAAPLASSAGFAAGTSAIPATAPAYLGATAAPAAGAGVGGFLTNNWTNLVGAGLQYWQQQQQANAYGDANQAQQDALQRAIEYQREQDAYTRSWNEQLRQDALEQQGYSRSQDAARGQRLAPYETIGLTGLQNLYGNVGRPVPPSLTAAQSAAWAAPPAQAPAFPTSDHTITMPSGSNLAALGRLQPSSSGAAASAGGTVLMQAPDGSTRQAPAGMVAQLEAQGARRIG